MSTKLYFHAPWSNFWATLKVGIRNRNWKPDLESGIQNLENKMGKSKESKFFKSKIKHSFFMRWGEGGGGGWWDLREEGHENKYGLKGLYEYVSMSVWGSLKIIILLSVVMSASVTVKILPECPK